MAATLAVGKKVKFPGSDGRLAPQGIEAEEGELGGDRDDDLVGGHDGRRHVVGKAELYVQTAGLARRSRTWREAEGRADLIEIEVAADAAHDLSGDLMGGDGERSEPIPLSHTPHGQDRNDQCCGHQSEFHRVRRSGDSNLSLYVLHGSVSSWRLPR